MTVASGNPLTKKGNNNAVPHYHNACYIIKAVSFNSLALFLLGINTLTRESKSKRFIVVVVVVACHWVVSDLAPIISGCISVKLRTVTLRYITKPATYHHDHVTTYGNLEIFFHLLSIIM